MILLRDALVVLYVVAVVLFLLHLPILKPWFGFRRPDDHRGRWFE